MCGWSTERNVAAPVCSSITMASVPPPARGRDNVQSQGLVSGDLHQLQHGKAPPSERNVAAPVCSSITMASVPPPARGRDNVQSQGLVSGDLHQLQHGKAPPSGEF
ncbi:hypothetical protein HID58_079730 [Brassica napus]|uniref:Uncharacterized protein n=1 Tax=Brassica napus TaxID=3708 RepID=A0ABQ7Y2V8_BRANA|nr:hypothetical protein HID58_079730 [Brassica napus]